MIISSTKTYFAPTRRSAAVLMLLTLLCAGAAADEIRAVSDERQSSAIREDYYSSNLDDSKGAKAAGPAPDQKNSYRIGDLSGVYGVNLSTTFRWYRDIDNSDANPDFLKWALQERAALWTSFSAGGWRGYFRGSMGNVDRGVGPTYTGIGADVDGPVVDLAFLTRDFETAEGPIVRLTAGRQVQYVGRGLVYYAVNDGLQVEVPGPVMSHKYFAARPLPHSDNIDFSVPGFDKENDRTFYGGEWTYSAIPRMSLYGYAVGQHDDSSENPVNIHQRFHYHSYYYGGGFAARPMDRLQLWGEAVKERGRGYQDRSRSGSDDPTSVSAWAWILGGKYSFDAPLRPVIETEGAYGSGDPDRVLVTNTVNGSADQMDSGFLYFGYYASGYALQPRLSNLYIYSAGFNFQPLSAHPAFERFLVGSKAFLYFKDEPDGGTSDFESGGNGRDLGHEWDAYIHWQVMPQLLWSVRYGIFLPGDGFTQDYQEPTQFLYTKLSWDL